jgi:hypothetical protein
MIRIRLEELTQFEANYCLIICKSVACSASCEACAHILIERPWENSFWNLLKLELIKEVCFSFWTWNQHGIKSPFEHHPVYQQLVSTWITKCLQSLFLGSSGQRPPRSSTPWGSFASFPASQRSRKKWGAALCGEISLIAEMFSWLSFLHC